MIFGNLLVMPIMDSLLYVQPLYLESQQTQLPQLQRVIVFYRSPQGGTLASGETQAVVMAPTPSPSPSPGQTPPPGTTPPTPLKTLIEQANRQFEAAQTALKAGDFAEYGRQINALQQTLSQLRSYP